MEAPGARGGPCSPVEVADAAVLGCVSLVICLLGWFIPHASGVTVLAAAPMAVIAYRHRARAVLAAAVAGSAVGFLVAGTGPLSSVLGCGLVGGIAGAGRRRGWGGWRVLGAALAATPPLGALADLWLYLFSATRRLVLEQVTNSWKGAASYLRDVAVLHPVVTAGDRFVHDTVQWWWCSVPVAIGWTLAVSTLAAWYLAPPLIERLAELQLPPASPAAREHAGPVGPVPVGWEDIHVRYPGAANDALRGVSGELDAAFTVLIGPNGSGKSTLARVIAGAPPTAGTVVRPGRAALGEVHGTAVIEQRPESQVLAVRVADDVVWGMEDPAAVDVGALLDAVGLAGMEARDTVTLSGGELQRLAIAAALARQPGLLVSDECTAMVDAKGRQEISQLLAELPSRGVAVLHVTHHRSEAAAADHVIGLDGGLVVPAALALRGPEPVELLPPPCPSPGLLAASGSAGALELQAVGHVWSARTPWARRALSGIDLRMGPGAGVVVVGGNGSGKSTLAWIMAGLVLPSEGTCNLGETATADCIGAIGLAFQHARLQLQRPTVLADVQAAGGVAATEAGEALRVVGLDPGELGGRSIETLSGGQLRRVALAGVLARRPQVLVLDEPLAGLDPQSRAEVLAVLRRLRAERGTALVMISHDLEGVGSVCDRIVELSGGRIESDRPLGQWA